MGGTCLGEQKSIQQKVVFNSCKLYYYTESRYISSPVAFDRMTLILFTFTSSDPNHSLTLKRSDSTHHSIPRIQSRLIFPCHEGHSTPTSTFNSSGSTPSFKGSVSTLSITLNVVYKI